MADVRSDSWYRWFPGDYIKDTLTLNITEDGAYRRMLDAYYADGGLPADPERLYNVVRARTEAECRAVDYVASKFFCTRGDKLINKRAELELQARREWLAEQSRKSALGVQARLKKINPPVDPRVDPPVDPRLTPASASASASASGSKDQDQERSVAPVGAPRSRRVFSKPTVEEIAAYAQEVALKIDPAHFWDFHEAKGWVIGKAPMKDWRAAVRTWCRRDGNGTQGPTPTCSFRGCGNTVIAGTDRGGKTWCRAHLAY